jgi:hypothetical protein
VAYANPQQTTLDWDILKREFTKFLVEEKPSKTKAETDFDFITTKGTDVPLERLQKYIKRLDISLGSTPEGEVFINGKPVEMSGVGWIHPWHTEARLSTIATANITTSTGRNWVTDSVSPRAGASQPTHYISNHPYPLSFIWAPSRMISPTFPPIFMTSRQAASVGTN